MRLIGFKLFMAALLVAGFAAIAACKSPVREPAVAGAFYPAEPEALRAAVKGYTERAENRPFDGELLALISPHAGYMFSAQVAAYGYKHLKGIHTVILIGPSHRGSLRGASVYAKGSFRTPLGAVKIDEGLAESLLDEKAGVTFNPQAHEKEHSLEVQLPFLQERLKDFKIVPIVIGVPPAETMEHLAVRLAEVLSKRKDVMLVASTDFSHYHDYETAVKMDERMISAIERLSLREVERLLYGGEGELCGAYPALLVMDAARRVGATASVLFKYANSGDVTGEKSKVVGYASIGIYRSPLQGDEKSELLRIARDAVTEYVKHKKVSEARAESPRLRADGAVFVTINRHGQLRGCIGHSLPVMPLYKAVSRNAVAACSSDPRFPPMTEQEMSDMEIEISVLSPLLPVMDVSEIEVGKHGLYILKDQRAGILLPQVPTNFGWDRETFLRELSRKAGLPPDAWKSGATLYKFTADIIK